MYIIYVLQIQLTASKCLSIQNFEFDRRISEAPVVVNNAVQDFFDLRTQSTLICSLCTIRKPLVCVIMCVTIRWMEYSLNVFDMYGYTLGAHTTLDLRGLNARFS